METPLHPLPEAKESPDPAGSLPSIFDYEDYRKYLVDRFHGLQMAEIGFSQRRLAREARIANPGYFNEVIKGRRDLTPDSAGKLAVGLRLNDPETEYFTALVIRSRCTDLLSRQLIYQRLARLKENRLNRPAARNPARENAGDLGRELESAWSILAARLTVAINAGTKSPPLRFSARRNWQACLNDMRDLRKLVAEPQSPAEGPEEPFIELTLHIRPKIPGSSRPPRQDRASLASAPVPEDVDAEDGPADSLTEGLSETLSRLAM